MLLLFAFSPTVLRLYYITQLLTTYYQAHLLYFYTASIKNKIDRRRVVFVKRRNVFYVINSIPIIIRSSRTLF